MQKSIRSRAVSPRMTTSTSNRSISMDEENVPPSENCSRMSNQNPNVTLFDSDNSKLKRSKSLTWDACTWNNNILDSVSSVCEEIPQDELASATLLDFLKSTGETPRLPKKSASFFEGGGEASLEFLSELAERGHAGSFHGNSVSDQTLGSTSDSPINQFSRSPLGSNKKLSRRATFANFPNNLSGDTLRGGADHMRLRREAGAYEHPPEWTTLPAMIEVEDSEGDEDDEDDDYSISQFDLTDFHSPENPAMSRRKMRLRRVNSAELVRRAFPEMLFDRITSEANLAGSGSTSNLQMNTPRVPMHIVEEEKEDDRTLGVRRSQTRPASSHDLLGATKEDYSDIHARVVDEDYEDDDEDEALPAAPKLMENGAFRHRTSSSSTDSSFPTTTTSGATSPALSPASPVPPGFSPMVSAQTQMNHHGSHPIPQDQHYQSLSSGSHAQNSPSVPMPPMQYPMGSSTFPTNVASIPGMPQMDPEMQQAMQQAMQQQFAMYMQQMLFAQQQAAAAANMNLGMNMGMSMGMNMNMGVGMNVSAPMHLGSGNSSYTASMHAQHFQGSHSHYANPGTCSRNSQRSPQRTSHAQQQQSALQKQRHGEFNRTSDSQNNQGSDIETHSAAYRQASNHYATQQQVSLTSSASSSSALMNNFKHKGTRPSPRELQGHVLEFACDSLGSRLLQQIMPRAAPEHQKALMDELIHDVLQVTCDLFGNYVIQVFLQHATSEQRDMVARIMRGSVLDLSKHAHGCRVVQRILELASPRERLELMEEVILDPNVLWEAAMDTHASHVLQKALLVLQHDLEPELTLRPGRGLKPTTLARGSGTGSSGAPRTHGGRSVAPHGSAANGHATNNHGQILSSMTRTENNELRERCRVLIETVEQLVSSEVMTMAINPNACRLVQRVLADCDRTRSDHVRIVMDVVESDYSRLALDQHGNFILQHILQFGQQDQANRIQEFVSSRCVDLAQHKFGSHLVEQCLVTGTLDQANFIVDQILDAPAWLLLNLMKDPYANFVLQRAYEISDEQRQSRIASEVESRHEILMQFTHGRHIISFLAKRRVSK
mmetsp:Transcript_1714/g.4028  ORF Transcript_1714/g.4028 Transcript_1714/m.4028 type:complete len:1058 (+) Transcript_1714:562-3735(+)